MKRKNFKQSHENHMDCEILFQGEWLPNTFSRGDIRTEEDGAIVDLWQEALDADAIMLTDYDKATILTEQEKAVAQQYLNETDWYVIRANEPDGKPIPADVLSARVEARAKL